MNVGDLVLIRTGAQKHLTELGYTSEYMTESIDGKKGIIVKDNRDAVLYPHYAVGFGFEYPVGISEEYLEVIDCYSSYI